MVRYFFAKGADAKCGCEESSAHALCFMVCLLALHPEAQAKVYAEACELWPEAPSLNAPPVRVSLCRWQNCLITISGV
jgi:cytochrome P450